jgi:putative acetyltransferase
MRIIPGDFDDPQVVDLLQFHQSGMVEHSPPGTCHVLDLSGLRVSAITFLTAWGGDHLLGCGALKELSPEAGEIKSMRTWPQHLRKGVAAAILAEILSLARSRGYRRLSLETGTGEAFKPALAMYRRHGFVNGGVFGDYRESDFNQFLHLEL